MRDETGPRQGLLLPVHSRNPCTSACAPKKSKHSCLQAFAVHLNLMCPTNSPCLSWRIEHKCLSPPLRMMDYDGLPSHSQQGCIAFRPASTLLVKMNYPVRAPKSSHHFSVGVMLRKSLGGILLRSGSYDGPTIFFTKGDMDAF